MKSNAWTRIGAANRATEQVLRTPVRPEALALRFSTGKDPGHMMPRTPRRARSDAPEVTSLYRYYDHQRTLIYVGITDRGLARNGEHNGRAEWWRFVATQEVDHFATRSEALAKEKSLIQEARPPFNKQHNPDHKALRAAYLAWRRNTNEHADPERLLRDLNKTLPLIPMSIGSDQHFALRTLPEHSVLVDRLMQPEGVDVVAPKLVGRVERIQKGGPFGYLLVSITHPKRMAELHLPELVAAAAIRFATPQATSFRLARIQLGTRAEAARTGAYPRQHFGPVHTATTPAVR